MLNYNFIFKNHTENCLQIEKDHQKKYRKMNAKIRFLLIRNVCYTKKAESNTI